MKCRNCNAELLPDAKFCTKCGAKVESNEAREVEVVENSNVKNNKGDTKALVGFILGLCSIAAWFIPLFGYPVTITGIVFSVMGLKSNDKGKATAGLILSVIFLAITLLNSIAGCIMMTSGFYELF